MQQRRRSPQAACETPSQPQKALTSRHNIIRHLLLAALSGALAGTCQVANASFQIDINGILSGHQLSPATAVPGQQLPVVTFGGDVIAAFSSDVTLTPQAAGSWLITAPDKPGVHDVHFTGIDGTTKSVQLLVTEPYVGQTSQSGYQIGEYPAPGKAPKAGAYPYPIGFVEVHKHNMFEPVSQHFQLHQFLCKQDSGWPRYVVLRRPLVIMLENIVTLLQRKGVNVQTLAVLSGYRTPAYNAAIDNVAYSRHVYGDAADIYVDADEDLFMDDLNGDGLVSLLDAQLLAKLIATLPGADLAGIGVYAANSRHGPFVHVDTRGHRARWGKWD